MPVHLYTSEARDTHNDGRAGEAPSYAAMHAALKQELSPRRCHGEQHPSLPPHHASSPHRAEEDQHGFCKYPSVSDVDDMLVKSPAVMGSPEVALCSLLASRNELAKVMHEQLAKPDPVKPFRCSNRVATVADNFLLSSSKSSTNCPFSPTSMPNSLAQMFSPPKAAPGKARRRGSGKRNNTAGNGAERPGTSREYFSDVYDGLTAVPRVSDLVAGGGGGTEKLGAGRFENIAQILGGVADILGVDASALATRLQPDEPLPDVYTSAEQSAAGCPPRQPLSPAKKAKEAKAHILAERPWLDVQQKKHEPLPDSAAAAAAHLLLYAEGLQGFREIHETEAKPGREVTALRDVPASKARGGIAATKGTDGIIVAVGGTAPGAGAEDRLTVKFDARADGADASIPVFNVEPSAVKLKHRRVIPLEALEKWGLKGKEFPSVAAHADRPPQAASDEVGVNYASTAQMSSTSFCDTLPNSLQGVCAASVPPKGVGVPPSLAEALKPLLHLAALGPVDAFADNMSQSSMGDDGFPTHGLSSHLRGGASQDTRTRGKAGASSKRYHFIVNMIGRYAAVVDDPERVLEECAECFDCTVDAATAAHVTGLSGKVTEVNIASETARLVFYGKQLAVWLPLSALTICSDDPMTTMGCRKTTVSVLGNPSSRDIQRAAQAISQHEGVKREQRRTKRIEEQGRGPFQSP